MAKNKHQTYPKRRRAFYKQPLFHIFILLLLAVGAIFLFRQQPKEPTLTDSSNTTIPSSKEHSTNTSDTTPSSSTAPAESNVSTNDSSISPDGKTPEKYEGADPNSSESITGSITTARFDNDKLMIRVNIDQYLSSGVCTLIVSDGTNRLEKTARLTPAAATSSCEGFDIASSELTNYSRPFDITINLSSDGRIGTITGRVE
ncbi:hypothetical protein IKG06_01700 [Candidatus Saccharibacteria bacterium]|nr:hypothetical protein [Candidatus Saccharibacteria bacterium]